MLEESHRTGYADCAYLHSRNKKNKKVTCMVKFENSDNFLMFSAVSVRYSYATALIYMLQINL